MKCYICGRSIEGDEDARLVHAAKSMYSDETVDAHVCGNCLWQFAPCEGCGEYFPRGLLNVTSHGFMCDMCDACKE